MPLCFKAQRGLYVNGAEASLRIDSLSFVSVDGEFVNNNCDPIGRVRINGALYVSGSVTNNDSLEFEAGTTSSAGKPKLIFRSTGGYPAGSNAVVSGSVPLRLWQVVMDKPGGSITLQTNVISSDTVTFVAGRIYLNGKTWRLQDPVGAVSVMNHPWIKNETSVSRFMGISNSDTGKVIYYTTYPQAAVFNPANIGLQLAGPLDHGSFVEFERGFRPQSVGRAGGASYFAVRSPAYGLNSNTVVLRHFASDAEYYHPTQFQISAADFYVAHMNSNVWTQAVPYTAGPSVSGGVTQSTMAVNLALLDHPNVALDGKALRFALGDPSCMIRPGSALNFNTMFICAGKTNTLDAGNMNPVPNTPLRYEWNSGPPVYTRYFPVTPAPHSQQFRVIITDAKGCVTRDSVTIAPEQPSPQFKYLNFLNACIGDSVTIKDTVEISSGTFSLFISSAEFTEQDTGNVYRMKFDAPGQYTVDLYAISDNGCSSVASLTNIQVYPLPSTDFEYSHDCVTDAVTFTSMAVSNHTGLSISNLLWNVGGSQTLTGATPSYTFPSAGTYTVGLTATSSFGCSDSSSQPVVIYPRNVAGFLKTNNCLGGTNTFTNTTVCNTGNCSYQWTLDNGVTSGSVNPQITYTAAGARSVKLKVNGLVGCPDSASALVFVHPPPLAQFIMSQSSACVNMPVYFTNATTIQSGSIAGFSWDLGNGQNASSTHASSSYGNAGVYKVRMIAVSDSGCVDSVSNIFTSLPQPVAQFQVNDVCHGKYSEFVSSSQGTALTHAWILSPGITKATGTVTNIKYTFAHSGVYTPSLIVSDVHLCSDTAIATTIVRPTPAVDLGGNIKTCGYSYTLDAKNPGSSFQWYPGNGTQQTIVVQTSGIYNVIVTGTNGCSARDSVSVTLDGVVQPFLGNDTTVCGEILLDAGYPGSNFTWKSGDTTQQITAGISGLYVVNVTDKNQCSGSDSIFLNILPPPLVTLAGDTTLCTPETGLVLTCISDAAEINWNTGSSSDSILVTSGGFYWVQAISADGCSVQDTVSVTFLPAPRLQLGADTGNCNYVDLDAKNAGCVYQWSDGSSGQYLRVTSGTLVSVVVTNTNSGCTATDSLNVEIYPPVALDLGEDTSFCAGEPYVLVAATNDESVVWLSGATTATVAVTTSGTYGADVTNRYGCRASDYVSVIVLPSPTVELGNDLKYICGDRPLEIVSQFTAGNQWMSDEGIISTGQSVLVSKPGRYWLRVTEGRCSATDTVLIGHTNHTIQAMFLASTMDTVNKPVKFVNLSSPDPVSQTWWFGDGATSSEFSPVHTYLLPTDFSVTLEVTNGYCTDRITKALSVLFRERGVLQEPRDGPLVLEQFVLFPNPASSAVSCVARLSSPSDLILQLTDLSGKKLYSFLQNDTDSCSASIHLEGLANGLYLLHISATSENGAVKRTVKFVKTN